MKKLSAAFWKRNLAFAKLAIASNLEYRLNYVIDALVQPILATGIEILLWVAVFRSTSATQIMGHGKENYIAYALWASFFSRISTSWMYEFRMVEEVASGTINSIIVRPMSFYEYYLSQLMGYKFVTTLVSLTVPFFVSYFFDLPVIYSRLPTAILISFYYLILVHTMSFLISTFAFHFTKISSITVAKNLLLWLLMGELFPLDLLPANLYKIISHLPFAGGIYVPVGYLTGRVEFSMVLTSIFSITISLAFMSLLCTWLWKKGMDNYVGTGA